MDINRLDKIDWESVVMEPMEPGEYAGTDNPVPVPENKHGNTYLKAILTAKIIRLAVKLIAYCGLIGFVIVATGTIQGNIDPPEFTYHQFVGFLEIVIVMILWTIVRRV